MSSSRRRPPSTSWEDVADWYRQVGARRAGDLAARALYPVLLRLLGPVEGRRVLDVGCGPGAFARLLAQRGARVVGVDLSPRMIEHARADAAAAGIPADRLRFEVADALAPDGLPRGPFDAASFVLSLQNMEDPAPALRNAAFRIPGATHWGWDSKAGVQFRRVDAYKSRQKVEIQIHPGSDPEQTRPSFHWPLEVLFGALRSAGLRALDLVEPVSDRVSEGGRAEAENRARRELPLFLAILAERGGRSKKRRG